MSTLARRASRVSGSVIYTPARWLRIEGTVGASEIKNRGHVVSEADRNVPFRIAGTAQW